MSILISVILLLVIAVNTKVFAEDSIAKAFQNNCIVPDFVTKAPNKLAKVKYPDIEINLGNLVNPIQVSVEPSVSWNAEPEKFYTLVLVGEIMPCTAGILSKVDKLGGLQHWLVVNIPGNHVDTGEVLSTYLTSFAPPGLGQYHYVFLIYEQRSKQKFNEPSVIGITTLNRMPFSLANFVKKYNFSDPLAGNFFLASPLNLNLKI